MSGPDERREECRAIVLAEKRAIRRDQEEHEEDEPMDDIDYLCRYKW
jgi:hypothetical protein